MALRRLMNEGDSLIHTAPQTSDNAADGEVEAADARPASLTVAKRRSEALRSFFPKLSVWLNNRIHFSRMREIESYLAQATHLADLEHRIARIERTARCH